MKTSVNFQSWISVNRHSNNRAQFVIALKETMHSDAAFHLTTIVKTAASTTFFHTPLPLCSYWTRRQTSDNQKLIYAKSRLNSLSAKHNNRLLFRGVRSKLRHYKGPFLDTIELKFRGTHFTINYVTGTLSLTFKVLTATGMVSSSGRVNVPL